MIRNPEFDDIRPYYDEEVGSAMQRIAASDYFERLASFIFPDKEVEQVRKMVQSITTTAEFQSKVMSVVNEQVIKRSITTFTYGGFEHVAKDQNYLMVSNHRDIVLDSSLLQYVLFEHDYDTTEITFGANLMMSQLIIDVGKSNKMFRVERGGNMKEFYQSSLHLSEYIRHVLLEKHQSVWIAQRNGRTKDGYDATDQGIIKMFCMSHPQDKVQALADLNIMPISVSYEWEPCAILKALELYRSRNMKYVKMPGEDLNSIMMGILHPKGHVHIEFCQPLSIDKLAEMGTCSANEYHKRVANLLDEAIVSAYRLMPSNYIAYDLLHGGTQYADYYTDSQKNAFIEHFNYLNAFNVEEPAELRQIYLRIYANPIVRKQQKL